MNLEKDIIELKQKVTPLNTAKFLVGTIISCGTMAAVAMALKVPTQASKGLTKWMMRLGIFVLACKAGDVAEDYFNHTVDEIVKVLNEAKEDIKNEPDTNE